MKFKQVSAGVDGPAEEGAAEHAGCDLKNSGSEMRFP
jgi:hypothetical protein